MPPAIVQQAAIAKHATNAPACRPDAIVLATDGRDGDFDGMSHGGTLLVLRNRGETACQLAGLPLVSLLDAAGRRLPTLRRPPPGAHPGLTKAPITLAPGSVASAPIRWVSGDVFAPGQCLAISRVAVAIGAGRVAAPLAARICGEVGKPAHFDQPPLATTAAAGR